MSLNPPDHNAAPPPPAAARTLTAPTSWSAEVRRGLYIQALDALVHWQRTTPVDEWIPQTPAQVGAELELFATHYLVAYCGLGLRSDTRALLDTAFTHIAQHYLVGPGVVVCAEGGARHMLHAATNPAQVNRTGAFLGPISYDIARLTRDAAMPCEEDFGLDVTIRYWDKARQAGLPVPNDFGEFYRAVEWAGLQQHLSHLGRLAQSANAWDEAQRAQLIAYVHLVCARYRELVPLMRLVERVEGMPTNTGYAFGRI